MKTPITHSRGSVQVTPPPFGRPHKQSATLGVPHSLPAGERGAAAVAAALARKYRDPSITSERVLDIIYDLATGKGIEIPFAKNGKPLSAAKQEKEVLTQLDSKGLKGDRLLREVEDNLGPNLNKGVPL